MILVFEDGKYSLHIIGNYGFLAVGNRLGDVLAYGEILFMPFSPSRIKFDIRLAMKKISYFEKTFGFVMYLFDIFCLVYSSAAKGRKV